MRSREREVIVSPRCRNSVILNFRVTFHNYTSTPSTLHLYSLSKDVIVLSWNWSASRLAHPTQDRSRRGSVMVKGGSGEQNPLIVLAHRFTANTRIRKWASRLCLSWCLAATVYAYRYYDPGLRLSSTTDNLIFDSGRQSRHNGKIVDWKPIA